VWQSDGRKRRRGPKESQLCGYLIVATGARHAYFGRDEWAAVAPGLKNIDDATKVRRKILLAFERAEDEEDAEEGRRLMTFVVVGGGPSGVEMAGAIAELAKVALASDFRAIDPTLSRIILIEAGERVLATFPESLSAAAKRFLEQLGVEVRLGARVADCSSDGVTVGDERIESRTIIWAAGIAASAAAEWLGAPHYRLGRVIVTSDLSLSEHPEVFVIGDTARVLDAAGDPLPGLAPVASKKANLSPKSSKRTSAVGPHPFSAIAISGNWQRWAVPPRSSILALSG
jgi:NADH:ubiquinone reductase (H+-translocating)